MYFFSSDGDVNNIKFWDKVSFFIPMQPRLAIFGPHIDHGGYMSANHVSPDHDLIFMIY